MTPTAVDREACLKTGHAHQHEGRYEEALRAFQSILDANPSDADAWVDLGKTRKMMNRCREAVGDFIQAVRLNPRHREAIAELGETSHHARHFEPAVAELERILREDPANEHAHVELGKILLTQGRLDAAGEILTRALRNHSGNAELHVAHARIALAQGDFESALERLHAAVRADPRNKNAHLELGRIYKSGRRYEDAVREFRAACDINPRDKDLRLNLVEAYALQGRMDLADLESLEVLKVVPEDPFLQDVVLNETEVLRKKTVLASKVKRLWVTVTTRCNIECKTCGLWEMDPAWELPWKTAQEVMALFPYMERVVWVGGEVFMYKRFEELYDEGLKHPNLTQQIITNGVILTDRWIEKIIGSGNELTFSVDGVTKEVFERIRIKADFDKLLSKIRQAMDLRRRLNSKSKIRMNVLIMRSNYHQFEKFLDMAKDFGFDQISFMAVHYDLAPGENIFYDRKDDEAIRFITAAIPRMREKAKRYGIDLDLLIPSADLKFDDVPKPEGEPAPEGPRPEETVAQARRAEEPSTPPAAEAPPAAPPAPAEPAKPAVNSSLLYAQQMLERGMPICIIPWKYLFICDRGKTYLAGSCMETVGNIHRQSLDEIWNGAMAQKYRNNILGADFSLCRSECMNRWGYLR